MDISISLPLLILIFSFLTFFCIGVMTGWVMKEKKIKYDKIYKEKKAIPVLPSVETPKSKTNYRHSVEISQQDYIRLCSFPGSSMYIWFDLDNNKCFADLAFAEKMGLIKE